MKLVITGALGHIGSRLIRQLPLDFPGAEMALLDNLATQRYGSLFQLPPQGRYRFAEEDVTTAELAPLLEGAEAVVHLAALTDPAESLRAPDLYERVNLEGTRRVAKACVRSGCPLLFFSTTSVYSKPSGWVDEDCAAEELKPQTPYAESKLKAEQLLQQMGRQEGLRFSVFRFGTVFGASPGMRFHTAVNRFCWQAAMGQPITVWRTALDQSRPYLELGDAIRAIEFILKNRLFDGRVYNVVTTHASVREILRILSESVPGVSTSLVEAEQMNSFSYQVSGQRLQAAGFECQGNLKEGIGQILQLLARAR